MEVPLRIQVGDLSPLIGCYVINLALVHALLRQGGADGEDLRLRLLDEHARQSMCAPLEQHVSTLDQALLDKFVTGLGRLARLTTTRKEDAAFFVLNRHEVRRNLDVDDIGPVAMRAEIVHVEVVSVVDEEMQGVQHLFVITDQRHLQVLVYDLLQLLLGFVFLMNELDLRLFFGFLDEEIGVADDLLGLFLDLFDISDL